MKNDIYTDSCDYIRSFGGIDKNGIKLSRSDASKIREGIAIALGLEDLELAEKLSQYYEIHEEEINKESVKKLLSVFAE